ncbi:hypothetical protein ACFOPN_00315 [Xanthomonas hyacinthi]|uniref:hypothetical protein n=1 Tax=Xanthomonas hyacinthi TaxID=56455 RepID=UPI003608535C
MRVRRVRVLAIALHACAPWRFHEIKWPQNGKRDRSRMNIRVSPLSDEKRASPAHFADAHRGFDGGHEILPMHLFPRSKIRCSVKV